MYQELFYVIHPIRSEFPLLYLIPTESPILTCLFLHLESYRQTSIQNFLFFYLEDPVFIRLI